MSEQLEAEQHPETLVYSHFPFMQVASVQLSGDLQLSKVQSCVFDILPNVANVRTNSINKDTPKMIAIVRTQKLNTSPTLTVFIILRDK
jgi:hypothetical protein